jgi:hypothetical protein
MNLGFLAIDNFYDDPDSIRNIALSCEYYDDKVSNSFKFGNAPWPGKMSVKSHSPAWVDAKISKLLGKNLRQMRDIDSGKFRISQENTISANMLHADGISDEYYAGVVYLTPDKENIPGTIFYRHLPTNSDKLLSNEHLNDISKNNEFNDMNKWQVLLTSNIIYNRLIIYPSNKFHGIGPVFGDTDDEARLIQLFTWIDIK